MTNILIQSTLRCMQRGKLSIVKYAPIKRFVTYKKLLQMNAIKDTHYQQNKWHSNKKELCYSLGLSLSFFGLFKSKEEKEPELITTIKRSILLIQKNEYKRAEQMLHIALKQAQDLQNAEAITYIYDLMANLAFIDEDYKKAEKLFVNVMQRLMSDGVPENDLRIIHMSLKMAKMYEYQEDYEKAVIGYKFCLNHLQKYIDEDTKDLNIITFYGMTMDWYARTLVMQNKYEEAFKYFLKAYEITVQIYGEIHLESVILLNDLGTISCYLGNHDKAIEYIMKALEIGKQISDMTDISIIYTNLGNVYIKKKMYEEAKKWCKEGWKIAKSKNDDESLKEANLCLDEVNKILP